jgi:hypothetical protein
MLDYLANQASGLIGLGAQPGPRLMAVASHGDEQAELPLLWQLCLALVNFGYTVTALDATSHETDSNPGLAQLLKDTRWGGDEDRQPGTWAVLPAAEGVQSLQTASPIQPKHIPGQLGRLFPQGSIVILYCKAEWMIPLVGDCAIEPLLPISSSRRSLMSGYMALKRMLITGKLQPTIINMILESESPPSPSTSCVATSLGVCAKRFLGYDAKVITIVEQHSEVLPYGETQRLALQLLENSLPLGAQTFAESAGVLGAHLRPAHPLAGSH